MKGSKKKNLRVIIEGFSTLIAFVVQGILHVFFKFSKEASELNTSFKNTEQNPL